MALNQKFIYLQKYLKDKCLFVMKMGCETVLWLKQNSHEKLYKNEQPIEDKTKLKPAQL